MSLVTDYWEWDTYWEARRRGRRPGLSGHLAPESAVRVDVGGTEVEVRPGLCVAWTASEGLCMEPAGGLACVKHAEDFEPIVARRTRLTPEDIAYIETLPQGERAKAKNRISMKRARQDPEQNARMKARRREMRAAHVWSS